MKHKIFTLFFLLSAVMVFGAAGASALSIDPEIVNVSDQTVTFRITGSAGNAGKTAALVVYRPGKGPVDAEVGEPLTDAVNYIGEVTLNEGGEGIISYKMKGESGDYTARVRISGTDDLCTQLFSYFDMTQINALLEAVNRSTTPEEVQAAMEEELSMLGADLSVYQQVPEDKKTEVYRQVLARREKEEGGAYTTIDGLRSAFLSGADFAAVNYSGNLQTALEALERQSKAFGLHESVYKLYETFDLDQKQKAIKLMRESPAQTEEALGERFDNGVVCTSVNTAANWSAIVPALKSVNDVLKMDFSGYDSLSRPANVFQTILKTTYRAIDDFIHDFYTGVQNGDKQEGGNHNNGPTGGGGSGRVSLPAYDQATPKPQDRPGQTPEPELSFTDLEEVRWAYDAIAALTWKNIISGKSPALFCPNDSVTREEFIKLVILAFDWKGSETAPSFSDVDPDAWYAPYIAAAQELGITSGMGDGTFGVGRNITREEMAALAYQAAKGKGMIFDESVKEPFTDDESIGAYAKIPVYAMKNGGIINGMEDGSFRPGNSCTRAQAAKIIYLLTQYSGVGQTTLETQDSQKQMDAVQLLTAMGILNQEKSIDLQAAYTKDQMIKALLRVMKLDSVDRESDPAAIKDLESLAADGEITCTALLQCLVRITGYGAQAEEKGGYPDGYLTAAAVNGILDGVKLTRDTKLTKGLFAQLVRNAMEADMVQMRDSGTYETVKGESILTQSFGVYRLKGTVQGNEYTYLDSPRTTIKGMVDIGGVLLDKGNTAAELMLGEAVTAYYRRERESGENILLFIQADPKKDRVKKISASAIDGYSGRVLRYEEENGRVKNESIPATVHVIYNGRFTTEVTSATFQPKNGYLELFDNDGDGAWDVVKVEDTKDYVVGYLDNLEQIIYDKLDVKKQLNLKDVEFVIVDREGKLTSWSDLQQYDILTVAQSTDGEVVKIVKSTETVIGKVTSSGQYNNYRQVGIDGESYLISPEFDENTDIKNDGSQIFLLNAYGQIAAARTRLLYDGYAYLLNAYVDENTETTLYLKVLDNDGSLKILQSAQKLKIDGKTYNDLYQAVERLKAGKEKAQDMIFQYQSNGNGVIVSMDLPYNGPNISGGVLIEPGESYNSLNKFYSSTATIKYKQPQYTFSGKLNLNQDALVFLVPTDLNTTDDRKFKVGGVELLTNDANYAADAYRMSKDGLLADVLVVRSNTNADSFPIDTAVFVVGKAERAMYEDEICTLVTGYQKNVPSQFYLTPEMRAKYDLDTGDIIRVNIDGLGYGTAVDLMFDYSKMEMMTTTNPSNSSYNASDRMYYTGIYAKDGEVIVTPSGGKAVTDNTASYENYLAGAFTIYIVDPSEERGDIIRKGTMADLYDYQTYGEDYSRIFIRMSYGKPREMIVIK